MGQGHGAGEEDFTHRAVPALALLSAFSFLVMMFNVPVFGGTTAHAVGGTLMAILLGPWAAVLGGVIGSYSSGPVFRGWGLTAIGANCFNMGFVLPFVGYLVYRLIGRGSSFDSRRRWLAAAIGGYIGINAAALMAAIEFGVQPYFFQTASGAPLYCPYDLSKAVPAMLIAHLAIAGPVEAAITGAVVAFLGKYHPEVFKLNPDERSQGEAL